MWGLFGQGVFFLLWPLFARAPRHWFLEISLLSAPGVQSVFFVALRWASPRPFGGARAKENTTQGVVFCSGPGERQGKEKPRAGTGPEQKKKTGKEKPRWAPARGQSKKKTPPRVFFFFLLRPRGKAGEGEAPLGAGTGPEQKKNTPRPRADADSLTAGLGGDASPSPGCFFFFFLLRPRPDRGVVFAVAPPGRSLTHCGLGRFRQGPGVFFFLLRPRRVFLDNNKKCLGYYIGSKMTRRGHSKKTPLPWGLGGGHE